MRNRILAAAVVAGVMGAGAAVAAPGDIIVRAGASMVDPKSDNLKVDGGVVQVDEGVSFAFDVTYMFTNNVGLELLAAWPFNHDIDLETPTGTVNIGETDHLPPTLSVVYQFRPDARVRPYLGVGVNFTTFSSENADPIGADLDLNESWGPSIHVGMDIGINDRWFVNGVIRWIDIDTSARLDGDRLGTVHIDPFVYGLQVGYKFGRAPAVVAAAPVAAVAAAPEPAPAPVPVKPADSDGDGVPDSTDACPGTPPGTRVGPMGCDCDVTNYLTFAFNSAELTPEDVKILEGTVENLRRLNWITGVIEGHTDSVGDEAFNQGLSERRAATVRDFLAARGIGEGRMTAVGFGETRPIADNATAEGRAKNRRVVMRRTDCEAPK